MTTTRINVSKIQDFAELHFAEGLYTIEEINTYGDRKRTVSFGNEKIIIEQIKRYAETPENFNLIFFGGLFGGWSYAIYHHNEPLSRKIYELFDKDGNVISFYWSPEAVRTFAKEDAKYRQTELDGAYLYIHDADKIEIERMRYNEATF
jgi:hypothetical protein